MQSVMHEQIHGHTRAPWEKDAHPPPPPPPAPRLGQQNASTTCNTMVTGRATPDREAAPRCWDYLDLLPPYTHVTSVTFGTSSLGTKGA